MTTTASRSRRTMLVWAGAVFAGLISLGAASALIYFWVVLGDRGLQADASGTSGYTTPTEVAGIVISLVAAPLSFAAFIVLVVIGLRAALAPRR